MKKTYYIFLLLITTIILCTSCDWLEPEQDPTNQIYNTAATLIYDLSGENIFITDDSLKLFPSSKLTIPEAQRDSLLNQRYFITFQIESQLHDIYTINLMSMQMMSKKQITTIDNNDFIGDYKNEILNMKAIWCSNQYVNIITQVKGSGTIEHNYHLLYNPNIDSDTLYFTLRYDNNKDKETYTLQQAMYYDLTELLTNRSDSTTICLNYNSGTPIYDTLYLKIASK